MQQLFIFILNLEQLRGIASRWFPRSSSSWRPSPGDDYGTALDFWSWPSYSWVRWVWFSSSQGPKDWIATCCWVKTQRIFYFQRDSNYESNKLAFLDLYVSEFTYSLKCRYSTLSPRWFLGDLLRDRLFYLFALFPTAHLDEKIHYLLNMINLDYSRIKSHYKTANKHYCIVADCILFNVLRDWSHGWSKSKKMINCKS